MPPQGRDLLSADKLALAGGISGAVECLSVQPLDMAKTRLQLMTRGTARPTVSRALIDLMREGGVLRLYRGVLPELVAMTPKSSAMYTSYSVMLRPLQKSLGDSSVLAHGLAGFAAGMPEAMAVTPFQVVKVRLQSKEHLHRYTSTLQCVRVIAAEEGIAALATGLHVTIWRNSIWNGVFFGLMSSLRPPPGADVSSLAHNARTLVTGFVAGVIATCFNNPFDVIKSRIQAEIGSGRPPSASSPSLVGAWVGEAGFARMREVCAEEGVRGLYVGFTAKSLRMGFGGAIGMAAYEGAARWLAVAG